MQPCNQTNLGMVASWLQYNKLKFLILHLMQPNNYKNINIYEISI